jgi:hypothetical protein
MARFPAFHAPVLHAIVAAAALLFGAVAAGARADALGDQGFPQIAPVWTEPGMGLVWSEIPSIASLPPTWMSGDALVVLTPGEFETPGLRARLIAALLKAEAGVLELPRRPAGVDVESALRVGQVELHAGVVVLVTHGAEGEAAFEAASQARVPGRYGFSAVVHLRAGGARVLFGDAPPAQEWGARAALFCDLLASAHQAAMQPVVTDACQRAMR